MGCRHLHGRTLLQVPRKLQVQVLTPARRCSVSSGASAAVVRVDHSSKCPSHVTVVGCDDSELASERSLACSPSESCPARSVTRAEAAPSVETAIQVVRPWHAVPRFGHSNLNWSRLTGKFKPPPRLLIKFNTLAAYPGESTRKLNFREEKRAERARNEQFPLLTDPAGNGKAQPSRDTSHGLHPEGESLLVTPSGKLTHGIYHF
jgi:hypothetical protein